MNSADGDVSWMFCLDGHRMDEFLTTVGEEHFRIVVLERNLRVTFSFACHEMQNLFFFVIFLRSFCQEKFE